MTPILLPNSTPSSPTGNRDLPSRRAPTHDEIAAEAHRIYLESGCRDGNDLANWLEAERLLCETDTRGQTSLTQPSAARSAESRPVDDPSLALPAKNARRRQDRERIKV